MKFKVGDKVRVKKNLSDIEDFYGGYMDEMKELEGKIVTISSVTDNERGFYIKEDDENYIWDERAFEPINLKPTRLELLDMPVGTKIYTDAEDEDYQVWVKTSEVDFNCNHDAFIDEDTINKDLTLSEDENDDYGTKIIKIEVPTYETVYDYGAEVQEMTIAEIEKELGYSIKVVKEREDD